MITKFKAFICRTGCLSLLSIVFLSACSGPYYEPEFHPDDHDFKGIAQHLELLKNSRQTQKSTVDVIFFHGMGTHDKEWAHPIFNRIKDLLPEWNERKKCVGNDPKIDMNTVKLIPFDVCLKTYETGHEIKIETTTFTHKEQPKEIRLHAVIWSELTTPLKKKLCSDMSEGDDRDRLGCEQDTEYTRKRAELNAQLKSGLVNSGLSDIVIYLGETGESIQKAFRSSVCHILGPKNKNPKASLVIITSSLASHILVESFLKDGVLCNSNISNNEDNGGSNEQLTALQLLNKRILKNQPPEEGKESVPLSIFMAANQIPLLTLARPASFSSGGASGSELFGQFLGVLSKPPSEKIGRKTSQELKIEVIAFTDPNDLLSYELKELKKLEDVTITNVIISNEGDLFEAHTGYLKNPRVWELILCGKSKDCSAIK